MAKGKSKDKSKDKAEKQYGSKTDFILSMPDVSAAEVVKAGLTGRLIVPKEIQLARR